jgi:hypothetical protein
MWTTFKNQLDRQYVTMKHAFYRSTFMGQRFVNTEKRNKAIIQKLRYMSTISDGMAQSYNMLPHFGNIDTWNDGLSPHLQDILNHSQGKTIYRTFLTVNNCANLATSTFLDTVEKIILDERQLLDTVYHHIDGGFENTAYYWFAVCARRSTQILAFSESNSKDVPCTLRSSTKSK